MNLSLAFSRIALVYSLFWTFFGLYTSYVWSERAYGESFRPVAGASETEKQIQTLERDLCFQRSKQGSTLAFSHGMAAFLIFAVGVHTKKAASNPANER